MTNGVERNPRSGKKWPFIQTGIVSAFYASLTLFLAFGFHITAFANWYGASNFELLRFCGCTAISSSIAAWLILLAPKTLHALIAFLALAGVAGLLFWTSGEDSKWLFSSVVIVMTGAIVLCVRFAGVSLLSRSDWQDNQRLQFSLRTMLIAFFVVAAFFSTHRLTQAVSDSWGWGVCNTILFSLCDAGLTAGLFLVTLRPKYFFTSIPLAALVYVGFTALSLHWMPDSEFSDKWGYWWIVGQQTLMHSVMVFIPIILVRFLGYRVGTSPARPLS